MMVLFAARTQHLHAVLLPAIAKGQWVLCDRFTDATFAYQGGGRGIPFDRIERLEAFVQGDFQPDLTLLLDLPVEEGLARATRRGGSVDRFEKQDLAFKERIRRSYLRRQQNHPDRIQCVDASGTVDEIQKILRQRIQILLGLDTNRDDISVA
jgi:dTMP kinase